MYAWILVQDVKPVKAARTAPFFWRNVCLNITWTYFICHNTSQMYSVFTIYIKICKCSKSMPKCNNFRYAATIEEIWIRRDPETRPTTTWAAMLQNGANQRFELQAKSHPPVHAALWQQASEYIIFERGFLVHQVTNVINGQGEKKCSYSPLLRFPWPEQELGLTTLLIQRSTNIKNIHRHISNKHTNTNLYHAL